MKKASEPRRLLNARRAVVCGVAVALTACSDATAPRAALNPRDVAEVMPAVLDAFNRLAPSIESEVYREPTIASIGRLVGALENLDGNLSRFYVREIGSLMVDYRTRQPNRTDGSEVSAIELMLNAVTVRIGGGYRLPVDP